ncbi:MAG: SUMF1/EgtB/PvdO family nonheme iron enzyme [Nitrospirota bacterium]
MIRTALFLLLLLGSGSASAAESQPGPTEKPAGSGVIVHEDGYVLTAYHVVSNAKRITVVTPGEFRAPALLVSADRDQDLALLKIETVGLSKAPLGYAGMVRLDQEVIAAGFAFGLREVSVSRGRVTAVRTKGVRRVFQIDAAVNPGNSGGAVFNRFGEVIGIMTTKFHHPSGIVPEGMAFAVPISYATPLLANIPDFDFTAIGLAGRSTSKRKARTLDMEQSVREVARTTVRIETVTVPEPPAGTAVPPALASGREAMAGQKQEPGRKPAAEERDDSGEIVKVNQQLATTQQEELRRLAQQGIPSPPGMVLIPAGEFLMGSEDGLPDTRPRHRTYVSSFWIDQYEVVNERYRACVRSGACSPPKDTRAFDDPQKADHPVTNVTWAQARAFCEWKGGRLPTEAEWEKAARGTDGRRYPWGNSFDVVKVRLKERALKPDGNGTGPVGAVPGTASPYGVFDLTGGVWEWVKDWYADDFYATAPAHDPQGPLRGSFRVFRGGDWSQGPLELRTSYRGWDEMTYWGPTLGFRCAADAP